MKTQEQYDDAIEFATHRRDWRRAANLSREAANRLGDETRHAYLVDAQGYDRAYNNDRRSTVGATGE